MWLPEGGCLVFFEETNMRTPPSPYFRLNTNTIANSGLPFLVALLNAAKLPPAKKFTSRHLNVSRLSSGPRKSMGFLPLVKSVSPLKFPELRRQGTLPNGQRPDPDQRRTWTANDNRWSQFLAHGHTDSVEFGLNGAEITHELWFVLPKGSDSEAERRRKLAIRNVLSVIHGGSIVGHDFTRTLCDIHEIMVTFSKNASGDTTKASSKLIIEYLQSKRLDDVRNDIRRALCLLGWSEQTSVQWELGYLESFVHAAGMMSPEITEMPEYKRLSHITRTNLYNAFSGMQLVAMEVEDKLKDFDFSEMWTMQKATSSPAKKAFDAFQDFLLSFYEDAYGEWPPQAPAGQRWLDRQIVRRLQADFGALYDFLVDKDVHWDTLKAAYRRDWEIVCTDPARNFKADLKNFSVTDILVGFDDFHGLMHIPLPFPLLPAEDVLPNRPKSPSIFSSLRRREFNFEEEKQKFNTLLAFGKATNLARQSMFHEGTESGNTVENAPKLTCSDNKLLAAFQAHEQSATLAHVSLHEARLGRWILLYGVLQFLSSVSVDVDGLQYTEDVQYFLCPSITGSPPWNKGKGPQVMRDATPFGSHCWTVLDKLDEPVSFEAPCRPRLNVSFDSATEDFDQSPHRLTRSPEDGSRSEERQDDRTFAVGQRTSLYAQPNDPIRESLAISTATATSQWTDGGSSHPSISTAQVADAVAIPMQRGRLTEITRRDWATRENKETGAGNDASDDSFFED